MKLNLLLVIFLICTKKSDQVCRSTIGVTTCVNEILKSNTPIRINNYKSLLEFQQGTLEEIPAGSLRLLPEVKILQISNNKIKKLEPGSFDGVYNLESLSLYNNNLQEIKNGVFRDLGKVKNLNIGMNQIASIELDAFIDLKSLSELNLAFNNLNTVPNAINNLPREAPIKTLHLNNNKLKSLDSSVLSNLNKLETLNLNDNEISSITTNAFSGLANLKELNLKSNYLSNLNTLNILNDLRSLRTVKLSINSFTCQTLSNVIAAFENRGVSVERGLSKAKDNVNGISCRKN